VQFYQTACSSSFLYFVTPWGISGLAFSLAFCRGVCVSELVLSAGGTNGMCCDRIRQVSVLQLLLHNGKNWHNYY